MFTSGDLGQSLLMCTHQCYINTLCWNWHCGLFVVSLEGRSANQSSLGTVFFFFCTSIMCTMCSLRTSIGIKTACLPRMEVLQRVPYTSLDGAHSPPKGHVVEPSFLYRSAGPGCLHEDPGVLPDPASRAQARDGTLS